MKTIVTFTWTMEMNSIKQDDEYDEEKNIILARKLRDLIACWPGALGRLSYAVIWKVISHCLVWSMWREHNLRTFEGRGMSSPDLQSLFFRMLFDWIQVTSLFSFSSFQDFIDSCSSHSLLPKYTSSIQVGFFLIKHITYPKQKILFWLTYHVLKLFTFYKFEFGCFINIFYLIYLVSFAKYYSISDSKFIANIPFIYLYL